MKRTLFIIILGIIGLLYFNWEMNQPLTSQPAQTVQKTLENRTLSVQMITRLWKLTDIDLDVSSAMLVDAETGHVIYQENSTNPLPVASMSKLMTELLVLEAIEADILNWDSEISISDYAYDISHQPGYASVHLQQDKSYTVKELFHAMAIHSANGATIALAEAVSGNEKLFVHQMNNKANELGLSDSTFVNSTGLDNDHLGQFFSVGTSDDTNKMSAQDLITLARYLINHHPTILDVTSLPAYLANDREYLNTNWLLEENTTYGMVDGLKTGYTDLAGYCFTGTAQHENVRLISVVMGTESFTQRFIETEKLYEQAFEQMEKWSDLIVY
ncbi:D-alanyl-D-alanine carboxypeptidase family protein [Amphibacillus sp. Q70]|uniref:D-alanyl-D-alanine carboxypeptidase family protein n=1 Tax=Amphibacillus sp. Q70 TaxID=3453416 RepID=UPI003F83BAC3